MLSAVILSERLVSSATLWHSGGSWTDQPRHHECHHCKRSMPDGQSQQERDQEEDRHPPRENCQTWRQDQEAEKSPEI